MVEINYSVIESNICKCSKNDYLVLKSNAYGFNLDKVLEIAVKRDYHKFAIILLEDAIKIREYDNNAKILLLGVFDPKQIYTYERYNIDISINDLIEFKYLYMHKVNIQIAVNTGMNRFGINPEEVFKALMMIKKTSLNLTGIYSHNATSISNHIINQIEAFKYAIRGIDGIDIHYAASSLFLNKSFNARRIGDLLYTNSFAVYGKIIKINKVKAGSYIGYEYAYKLKKTSYVGIIDFGYADGLVRKCSGLIVYIKNRYYHLIGLACMNHSFVLLNDDFHKVGEKVHFISSYNHIVNYEKFTGKTSHEIYFDFLKSY